MILPVFDNLVEMFQPPRQKRVQMGHQAVAASGEAVFHPWRHLLEHLAADDAVLLEIPQDGDEHFLGNVRDQPPQLLETKYFVLFQGIKHQKRPFVGYPGDDVPDRTVGEGGVDDLFPVHRLEFHAAKISKIIQQENHLQKVNTHTKRLVVLFFNAFRKQTNPKPGLAPEWTKANSISSSPTSCQQAPPGKGIGKRGGARRRFQCKFCIFAACFIRIYHEE